MDEDTDEIRFIINLKWLQFDGRLLRGYCTILFTFVCG